MAATKHAQQIKVDSQQYLTTALLQLLQTHDLSDIKVTTLINKAGVSRMAFYRNYQTVTDILRAYFAPQIQAVFDNIMTAQPSPAKLAAMTAYFERFSADLSLSVDRHYEYLIQQLFTENMARYYAQSPEWHQLDDVTRRYWLTFMSNGVYGIWREWLLHHQHETLADMQALLGQLQHATAAALVV